MKLWLLNYEWIHDYLLLMLFWSMLLMNWYNEYPYLWIGDENCWCCWKFVKVWWIVEFWWNDVLISSFMHHWMYFHVYTCKHYLERGLGFGKIKIGILGEKAFETRRFFSELISVRLSEPSASVTSRFWTQFAWESSKRRVSRSHWNLVAQTNQTSLKRVVSCSTTFWFSFRALGDQSELPKRFLLA